MYLVLPEEEEEVEEEARQEEDREAVANEVLIDLNKKEK
jgi:hypothetical protein